MTATLTTLLSFDGSNGANPFGGLIADANGSLFGTTAAGGGASGAGTVFELVNNSGTYTPTTLVSFDVKNGAVPVAGLIADANGDLFGTTRGQVGAGITPGTVFELVNNSGTYTLTTLVSFDGSNGAQPYAGLLADANGDLFGTTAEGGASNGGTVFELVNNSGTYTPTTLLSFDGSNGAFPTAGLIADANGDLFGTTYLGGANNEGTVFELVNNSGTYTLTTLLSFDGSNGSNPYAGLLADANGDLFGTTRGGGANNEGTVFELVNNSGTYTLTTLLSFDGSNGSNPYAGLLADANGDLFGTTRGGGENNEGTVFELVNNSGTYTPTTLLSFDGSNGAGPFAGLIADANGSLFGTTAGGGASGAGTVFEITNSGFVIATPIPTLLYGDTSGSLTDHQIGGDQNLTLDDHIGGTAYGDADEMTDHAQGGNDTLRGGDEATNYLFGDANDMSGNSRGGDDTLRGGSGRFNSATNFVYGDAYTMSDNAQGGDDTLTGGFDNAFNFLYGDASAMSDTILGGNDTLTGGASAINYLFGDAHTMSDNAQGGDDTLRGGTDGGYNEMYGDAYAMSDNARGGNDTLTGGQRSSNNFYGDAFAMSDDARGGDDTLIGTSMPGVPTQNNFYGDAYAMSGNAQGGNDTLTGGDLDFGRATNFLIGDAHTMSDNTHGGNDTLTGGRSATNQMFGDAYTMSDNALGGNDTLTGGAPFSTGGGPSENDLYGDAYSMFDNSRGGDDTLIGGDGSNNFLYGDAYTMSNDARGGNDTLIGGDDTFGVNSLYGDAYTMSDNARGGNDTLISGTSTDHMWGDAQFINGVAASPTAATGTVITGADTFVFAPGNGTDDINDFRQSDFDRIDVTAYGIQSMAGMVITGTGVDTKIAFDATNSVTLLGISDPNTLHASDFIFA